MTRTKGSKNKPKFEQLAFDEQGNIAGTPGTVFHPNFTGALNTEFIQDEVTNNMEITHSLQLIHQGNFPDVEQDIKVRFFDKGWRLFATHFAGLQGSSMIIIYIFIRETSAS